MFADLRDILSIDDCEASRTTFGGESNPAKLASIDKTYENIIGSDFERWNAAFKLWCATIHIIWKLKLELAHAVRRMYRKTYEHARNQTTSLVPGSKQVRDVLDYEFMSTARQFRTVMINVMGRAVIDTESVVAAINCIPTWHNKMSSCEMVHMISIMTSPRDATHEPSLKKLKPSPKVANVVGTLAEPVSTYCFFFNSTTHCTIKKCKRTHSRPSTPEGKNLLRTLVNGFKIKGIALIFRE
jgi:hypothetical protein